MTQPTPQTPSDDACVVCAEPTDPVARADCYECGEYFHLKLTTTSDAPDCGDVWLDAEIMALQFACSLCLIAIRGEAPTPDMPATNTNLQPQTPIPQPQPDSPPLRRHEPGASVRDLARRRRNR